MLCPLDTYLDHLQPRGGRPAARRKITQLYRLLAHDPRAVILNPLLDFGTPEHPAWGVNGRSRHRDLNVSAIVKLPFDNREEAVRYHQVIAAMIADGAVRVQVVEMTAR
jgi:hypothetical protein